MFPVASSPFFSLDAIFSYTGAYLASFSPRALSLSNLLSEKNAIVHVY